MHDAQIRDSAKSKHVPLLVISECTGLELARYQDREMESQAFSSTPMVRLYPDEDLLAWNPENPMKAYKSPYNLGQIKAALEGLIRRQEEA